MRLMSKLFVLPVIMILSLIKLLLEGATRVYCLVAGIAINLLLIGGVLAIVSGQWFALGVFGILFVVILSVLLCAGTITVFLNKIKDKLQSM